MSDDVLKFLASPMLKDRLHAYLKQRGIEADISQFTIVGSGYVEHLRFQDFQVNAGKVYRVTFDWIVELPTEV